MKYYMDFSAILAIATAVAGVIWLVDVLFFKKKRLKDNPIPTNARMDFQ